MKGMTTQAVSLVETFIAVLLILMVIYGTQLQTQDFLKSQTVETKAKSVATAALALDSMPEGYVEVSAEGYEFKYEQPADKVWINYTGTAASASLEGDYDSVNGPNTWTDTAPSPSSPQLICLRKSINSGNEELEFVMGGC